MLLGLCHKQQYFSCRPHFVSLRSEAFALLKLQQYTANEDFLHAFQIKSTIVVQSCKK